MENIVSHIPLALFTTLGSLGAGAFIGLAIAFFKGSFDDEKLKAIDKKTWIPVIIAAVGFIAVFFHVTQPMKAFGVFAGVGSSPLSNEVVVGAVFMVLAVVYAIMGSAGKLGGARKGFAAVVAVVAVVFGIMMGMAYMVDTIPSWNNPGTILQMLGFTVAGSVFALLVTGDEIESARTIKLVSVVGVVVAAIGLIVQIIITNGCTGAVISGSALVSAAMPDIIAALGILAITVVTDFKDSRPVLIAISLAAGVFFARLAFYAMEFGIGL